MWRHPSAARRSGRSSLNPSDPQPHFLLGALAAAHDYDWGEAKERFDLAMAAPNVSADARWAYSSVYLCAFGRFEEAAAEMGRAVEQDPLNAAWRAVWSANLIGVGLVRSRDRRSAEGDRARRGPLHAALHPRTSVSGERTPAAGRHSLQAVLSGGAVARRPARPPRRNAASTRREGPRSRVDSRDGETRRGRCGDACCITCSRRGARRGHGLVREDDRASRAVRRLVRTLTAYRAVAAEPTLVEDRRVDEPAPQGTSGHPEHLSAPIAQGYPSLTAVVGSSAAAPRAGSSTMPAA